MSYGTNGSVIGPDNVPTASAAPGVWSLGEIAEAVRDDIWPAPKSGFEKIAAISPITSASSVTFSGIPATYKHLEIQAFSSTDSTFGQYGAELTNNVSGTTLYTAISQQQTGASGSMTISYKLYGNPGVAVTRIGAAGSLSHGTSYHGMFTNYINAPGSTSNASGAGQPMIWEGASYVADPWATFYGWGGIGGGNKEGAVTGDIDSITISIATSATDFETTTEFVLYGYNT